MFASARPATLLLTGVALVIASASSAQPPGMGHIESRMPPPAYTAFPELSAPIREVREAKLPDGTIQHVIEEKGMPALQLPKLPVNPTPLQRVQLEQVLEGLAYLAKVKEVLDIGTWNPAFYTGYISTIQRVYQAAAELEARPEDRVRWIEARVIQMKAAEQFMEFRTRAGNEPPQNLHLARFDRLQAEAELLKLKADIEPCQPAAPVHPSRRLRR